MIKKLAERLPGESALLDAQLLLAHVSRRERAWWLSHPEAALTPEQEAELERAVHELQNGTPLAYVLGHWGFFGLDFIVTPDVLIPRPETELLVETALAFIREHPREGYAILDIGTGSGIIPVSLALHVPRAALAAVDISPAALEVARRNATLNGVAERIEFIQADLLPEVLPAARFDLVCANLPYIPTKTFRHLEIYGKEPTLALDGGEDGLDHIRSLLEKLASRKVDFDLLLLEIEQGQGAELREMAQASFPLATVRIQRDLAGFDRLAVIEF
ncbi:MAG TPA: peptide chain release factor N(5)-glutamine methyltransferase [Anaerolineales bacterium]|jgi:release factor glutamine methyltransferase